MSKVVHTLRGRDERARDEMLEALRHEVAQALQGHGIAQDSAEHIAQSAVEHVIRIVAGQTIYFPSAYASYVTERAQAIAAEFNGVNHRELARKWNISARSVYRILKRTSKGQGALA